MGSGTRGKVKRHKGKSEAAQGEKNEEQGMARGELKYHPCPLGAGMDGIVRYVRDARDQRAGPKRRVRRVRR